MSKTLKRVGFIGLAVAMAVAAVLMLCVPARADQTQQVQIEVEYGQTAARSMLEYINLFRTGNDVDAQPAEYWNKDNTTKTVCSGLQPLVYDYSLERTAMQRAAEIAMKFAHARPNGETSGWNVWEGVWYAMGENIAANYSAAPISAFRQWREDNDLYAGQGHRRSMLSSNFTRIGIGHVVYGGVHFWTQAFGKGNGDDVVTDAADDIRKINVDVSIADIQNLQLSGLPESIVLTAGETASLSDITASFKFEKTWPSRNVTVTPNPVWVSSDTSVPTIDGLSVVGVSGGETTISANILGQAVSIPVTVKTAVTGVRLDKSTASIYEGETTQLYAAVEPADATNRSVTWSSSDESVATVDQNGLVSGVGEGSAIVTVTTNEGNKSASCNISVSPDPSKVKISTVEGIVDKVYTGKEQTLDLIVKDLHGNTLREETDYTVSYSNNINAGEASVTIKGQGNYSGIIKRSFVIMPAEQKITVQASAALVAVGKSATVNVGGAKGKKTFTSSNESIASVTADGKITAKKVGTVKITVTSAATQNYTEASETVTVKVVPAATTSVTAANQSAGMKVSWKKVAGATGYLIYRNGKQVKKITNANTVSFADTKANTNGAKYVYKVVAYAGTGTSPLSKSITTYKVARPAVASLTNSASKKATVKWKKNAKASGYQIQYSTSKTFASGNKAVTIAKAGTASKVLTGLAKSKTYYVRIRTFKTVGGTKYYSAWSTAKGIKIKK